ncbi:MAG: TIGR03905 family TSCPD domain-containing protein [Planctomycetia bacterium]|nr:TIGR03905 family TSCPD domain-containing protein [Planctomycetia bacterium]
MNYSYKTSGTCSKEIRFSLEDGRLHNVSFLGGCNGNLQGIGKLVEGQLASEVVNRLEGISCAGRPTSCPDQLAQAIRQALANEKSTL